MATPIMQIYKKNNRYAFRIGPFDSAIGFFVFPHVKSSYKEAWAAERDARRILKETPSLLTKSAFETDAQESETFSPNSVPSAENMIVSHYLGAYDSLVDKTEGVKDSPKEKREKVYQEIKIVVENLLKIQDQLETEENKKKFKIILGKFSRLTKENFNDLLNEDKKKTAINVVNRFITANVHNPLSDEEIGEILEDAACRVCEAIAGTANDAAYIISPKNKKITIVSSDRNIKYVTLLFDSNMLLSRVLPHSLMPKNNSSDFYQHILKPIFASVGHLRFPGKNILLVNGISFLPDANTNEDSFDVDGLDLDSKSPCSAKISFRKNKWLAAKSSPKTDRTAQKKSSYTQEDYMAGGGALVECTDQNLKSLFGEKGKAIKVWTYKDTIYVYCQFGHNVVRLKEEQIQLISDGT